MPTEENKWSRPVLLGLTILWLVVGAGLFSYMGTVPTPLNASIIRLAGFVLPDGREILWQNAPVDLRIDLDHVETEVRRAEAIFLTLGRPMQPVRLKINYQNPLRYRLNHEQLEIGSAIALKSGQLRHALLKAWIIQNLDFRFSQSLLRLNVLADALIAITENGLAIENPNGEKLELGKEGASLVEQISTFGSHCKSAWVPMDVSGLCQSVKPEHEMHSGVSAFSLRRTLSEGFWASVSEFGAFERVQFLRAWLEYLEQKRGETVSSDLSPATEVGIVTWRNWASTEFGDILPANLKIANRVLQKSFNANRVGAEKLVGLSPGNEITVDLAARFESADGLKNFEDDMRVKKYQIGQPTFKAAVVQIGEESWLLPGRISLKSKDLESVRSKRAIWESCNYPDVDKIVGMKINADRVMLVRRCAGDESKPLYRSYVAYGIEGFALDNPELQFVHVHRPSLEFAAEKGLVAKKDIFQHLGEKDVSKFDRKLGLNDAQWNQQMGAFRVIGAIEAIEWYRLDKPTPN